MLIEYKRRVRKFPLWLRLLLAPFRLVVLLVASLFAILLTLAGEDGDRLLDAIYEWGNK